jgi:hypothetical protein
VFLRPPEDDAPKPFLRRERPNGPPWPIGLHRRLLLRAIANLDKTAAASAFALSLTAAPIVAPHAEATGERRHVTVTFSDLIGAPEPRRSAVKNQQRIAVDHGFVTRQKFTDTSLQNILANFRLPTSGPSQPLHPPSRSCRLGPRVGSGSPASET